MIKYLPNYYYELQKDIILPEVWTPIGTEGNNFSGVLDGNGHTIEIFDFEEGSHLGIFAVNNGDIYNLKVRVKPSEKWYADQSNWYVGAICGENSGKLINCHVDGGFVYNVQRSDSGWGNSYFAYIGCIAGLNSGTVSRCSVRTDMKVDLRSRDSDYIGGVTGYNSGLVEDSYYIGDIKTTDSRYVGGLAGFNSGKVNRTYAAASVSGKIRGGLIAAYDRDMAGSTVSYYDKEVSGLSHSDSGYPKTTAEMKSERTYSGWDFLTVWDIDADINNGYPYLLCELAPVGLGDISLSVSGADFQKNHDGLKGSITAQISNYGEDNETADIFVAIYGDDGVLAGIKRYKITARPGSNRFDLDNISVSGDFAGISCTAKIFAWDAVSSMEPLVKDISIPV